MVTLLRDVGSNRIIIMIIIVYYFTFLPSFLAGNLLVLKVCPLHPIKWQDSSKRWTWNYIE
jgi:hypothetical protein